MKRLPKYLVMFRALTLSVVCLVLWSIAPGPSPLSMMVFIPGGTFTMGDHLAEGRPNESPVHKVTLSDFYMSATEVTVREFAAFVAATGYTTHAEQERGSTIWQAGEWHPNTIGINWRHDYTGTMIPASDYDLPVVHICWQDAIAYCNWKSTQSGLEPVYITTAGETIANWSANGFRLPTEAEWEYAARAGGQNIRFGNGANIIDPQAANFYNRPDPAVNYAGPGDSFGRLLPVASLNQPNALGLHDMAGNVWEWCWDWYGPYTGIAPSGGPSTGTERVCRGGGWTTTASGCRATYRNHYTPGSRSPFVGFRLARSF